MILATYTQTPDESRNYLIDYSSWLDTGETVVSSVATVDTITVPPLSVATAITVSLTSVALTISGGLVDNSYTIKVTTTTSTGQIKEDCVDMYVEAACG